MTKNICIKHVDVFTKTPFHGNPCAVVFDAGQLSDDQMQSIASELNSAETAFIIPPSNSSADQKIKWYSPTKEISSPQVGIMASAHVLAEERKIRTCKDKNFFIKLETDSGILPVEVHPNGVSTEISITSKFNKPERTSLYKVELIRLLRISQNDLDPNFRLYRCGFLLVPVRRLYTLFNLQPDFILMAEFLESRKLDGICVYTTETIDRESLVHARYYTDRGGVSETLIDGEIQGSIGMCLFEKNIFKNHNGHIEFQAEHGDATGRPGRMQVHILLRDNIPISVKITGSAVTTLEGKMRIPS